MNFIVDTVENLINVDFHCSQHSSNITRSIQSVRWAECIARMGNLINTVKAAYNGRARGRILVVFDRFRFMQVLEVCILGTVNVFL